MREARRRPRRYSSDQARRWLGCLAYNLYRDYNRDLLWWRLTPGLMSPWPVRTTRRFSLMAVVFSGLIAGLGAGVVVGVAALPVAFLAMIIFLGNETGWLRRLWVSKSQAYVVSRWEFPSFAHTVIYLVSPRGRFRRACAGISFGLLIGLIIGLLINALLLGIVVGLLCGLVQGLMPPWHASIRPRIRTPRKMIGAHSWSAAITAVRFGVISGIIFMAAAALLLPASRVLIVGSTAALVCTVAAADGAGLRPGFSTSWHTSNLPLIVGCRGDCGRSSTTLTSEGCSAKRGISISSAMHFFKITFIEKPLANIYVLARELATGRPRPA